MGERHRRPGRARRTPSAARSTFDSPEGKAYRRRRAAGPARRPAARLAPDRVARPRRRRADLRLAVRRRAVPVPQRRRTGRRAAAAPYLYLPKLESHQEARLWNDVFVWAQARLGVPRGSIRATVLIETIRAAFEMDEILYELREHAAGLNAGRWDYLFSAIKKFRACPTLLVAGPRRS